MNAEVFRRPTSFNDIVDFFKSKGFKEVPYSEQPEYLEGKTYRHLEVDDEGTTLTISLYSSDSDIEDLEKELKNWVIDYVVMVRNDFSEYLFYKYTAGRNKVDKLRKKTLELEPAFLKKLDKISFDDLESLDRLFDRSELIREFYELYCYSEVYLMRHIKGIPVDEDREVYAKILMDRLIFLWFLQKKGFLNDDPSYLKTKFEGVTQENGNYFKDFLTVLFFEGLCMQPSERPKSISNLLGDVPYLNGGLFIRSDIELRYGDNIRVANEAFYRPDITYPVPKENERNLPVLNLLECKEWTIDERGGEADKLNPEILGYIFEKSINKRELGAVYTPEEVTSYICDNAINRYIVDRVNDAFGSTYSTIDEILRIGSSDTLNFVKRLVQRIRVVDPAVGSGHFLLDALITLESIYHKIREAELIDWDDYKIRHHIITENLYGVDILQGAIEICKLRLFLSLAVTFVSKEQIQPLPNIDFNIRRGDSLVGYTETRQVTGIQVSAKSDEAYWKNLLIRYEILDNFFDDSIVAMFKVRNQLVREYRIAKGQIAEQKKRELSEMDRRFNTRLNQKLVEDLNRKGIVVSHEELEGRYPFHWVMEFSEVFEEGGFDVVIGNPPYIENREIDELEKRILKDGTYQTLYKQWDYYVPFIERSFMLLKEGGSFGFIVSNKFLVTDYGYLLRRLLLGAVTTTELVDVSYVRVFRESNVYPVILLARRIPPSRKVDRSIAAATVKELSSLTSAKRISIPIKLFSSVPGNIISTSLTEGDISIIEKVFNRFPNRYNFHCGVAISGFGKAITNTKGKDNWPILQGEEVRPFVANFSGKYVPSRFIPSGKQSDFRQRKILIPGMVTELYAGLDLRCAAIGRIYYLTEEDAGGLENLKFLTAILNSSLLRYTYKKVFGSVHMAGGFLRVNSPYLKIFCFPTYDSKTYKGIVRLVDAILQLKQDKSLEKAQIFIGRVLDAAISQIYLVGQGEGQLVDALQQIAESVTEIDTFMEKIQKDPRIVRAMYEIEQNPFVKTFYHHLRLNSLF